MKTKLGHLIIASLISLSVVSTISMSYAGSFVIKRSTSPTTAASGLDEGQITQKESTSATTSASGFSEGPITQKHYIEGFSHLEKYEPPYQLLLDLEINVDVVSVEKIGHVIVKNISQATVTGPLYIVFLIMDTAHKVPPTSWIGQYPVPLPNGTDEISVVVPIPDKYLQPDPENINYNPSYQLHAMVNWMSYTLYDESDFTNNHDFDDGMLYNSY